MSILDRLTSQVTGAGATGQHAGLVGEVADLLNNPATGGLAGLSERFHANGLGGVISSWISTGPNQPISADQLTQVLGPERIQAIASKLGVAPETVTAQLSTALPQVIDRLTPNGTVPEGGLLAQGLALLRTPAT